MHVRMTDVSVKEDESKGGSTAAVGRLRIPVGIQLDKWNFEQSRDSRKEPMSVRHCLPKKV